MPDAGELALEVRARAELGDFVLDVEHTFVLSGVTGLFGPSWRSAISGLSIIW